MTVSFDQFDTLRRLVEQLGAAQLQGRAQHDREMTELRQLQASSKAEHDQGVSEIRQLQSSNGRAIEALTSKHDQEVGEIRQLQASNAKAIEALTDRVSDVGRQVSELSVGVDAAFRTIESMHRMTESLELVQIEMRQNQEESRRQHQEQMERLGRTLDLLMTRYPTQD